MKIFIIGEDGDMEEMDPNKEGAPKGIMDFLRMISGGIEEKEVPPPREIDHGWWNCEGCRELQHKANLERVQEGMFTDDVGTYFSLEYLKDMSEYYSLETNVCINVMSTIDKWNKAVKDGVEIPISNFY